MTWLFAVLLSTVLFGWVSVLDKKLITDLFPGMRSFYLVFGLMQLVIGGMLIAGAVVTGGGISTATGVWWSIGSGLALSVGLMLFFYGLRIEEVSRAAPMQSLSPVFGTLLAVIFLDETLSPAHWAAILTVVTGGVLVNLRRQYGRIVIARGKAFFALLGASAALGSGFVAMKQATDILSVAAVQGIGTVTLGVLVLAFVMRPHGVRHLPAVLRRPHLISVMLLCEGILAPAAFFTLVWAFALGPVSLVSVVYGARPLLVLIISIALSTRYWNVLKEPFDRQTIGLKIISTLLVVSGVGALAMLPEP